MSEYTLDDDGRLHCINGSWLTTKEPLTDTQKAQFKDGTLDVLALEWVE